MLRFEIINALIKSRGYTKFAEIGVYDPSQCHHHIQAELKHGIDPAPECFTTHHMTSNDFFAHHAQPDFYDVIFIDGLHLAEQVYLDIHGALRSVQPNGVIVMHDCLPTQEGEQTRENNGGAWCGDVWKGVATFRRNHPEVECYVIDTDWGCGIVERNGMDPPAYIPYRMPEEFTWGYFQQHKKELLDVVTVAEFTLRSRIR